MTATSPRCTVRHGHHDVYWVEVGRLTVAAVPALGGRLLSLQLDGRELLWRNTDLLGDDLQPTPGLTPQPTAGTLGDWRNYGGDKTWPAPQGWSNPQQWAGPPDPVLDSGVYAVVVDERHDSTALTMTSAPDPRTGLQLSRTLTVREDTGFTLDLGATNVSDDPVSWALWNVTQLHGGGVIEVEVTPQFVQPVALVDGTGVPGWNRTGARTVSVGPQDVVGKLGFPHAAGRLLYHRDGITMTWNYPVDDSADYPDGGSRAEVWLEHPQPAPLDNLDGLDPPGRIVECEVLSPTRTLSPGQATSLRVAVGISQQDHHDTAAG